MKVKILDLKITDGVLEKSGYDDEILTMENLVPWKSLKSMQSFSRGPGYRDYVQNVMAGGFEDNARSYFGWLGKRSQ